jgi:hypothetical protein
MWNWASSIETPQENRNLTQQMWEAALQRVAVVLDRQPNAGKTHGIESSRSCSLTMDPSLFQQQLVEFAKEVTGRISSGTRETNWLRLSSILSQFAAKC